MAKKKREKEFWFHEVRLVRVIDGDTAVFSIDVGFDFHTEQTVRFYGINAPEVTGKEKKAGLRSTQWVKDQFKKARQIVLRTYKRGKFGRIVADIYLKYPGQEGMTNLCHYMAMEGYAKPQKY